MLFVALWEEPGPETMSTAFAGGPMNTCELLSVSNRECVHESVQIWLLPKSTTAGFTRSPPFPQHLYSFIHGTIYSSIYPSTHNLLVVCQVVWSHAAYQTFFMEQ